MRRAGTITPILASLWQCPAALLALSLSAAAAGQVPEESPRLIPAQPAGAWTLQWNGRPGRTYFVQQSHDLRTWTYVNTLHHGDGVKMLGAMSTGEKYFLRLRHTDIPCVDPAAADFDGDGLNNADELFWLADPFNPDSDGDGFLDGWEVLASWNPATSDAAKAAFDDDGDGVDNQSEHDAGTRPGSADSDNDGLSDLMDAAPSDPVIDWRCVPEPYYAVIPIPDSAPPPVGMGPPGPDYGQILAVNSIGEVLANRALWTDARWQPLKQTMAPVPYTFRKHLPDGSTMDEPIVMQMTPGSGWGWKVDDHGGVLGTADFPQVGPQVTPWGEYPVYWPSPDADPVLVGFPPPGSVITAGLPLPSFPLSLTSDGWIGLCHNDGATSIGPEGLSLWNRASPHQSAAVFPGLTSTDPRQGTFFRPFFTRGLLEGGMASGVDFVSGTATGVRWHSPDGQMDYKPFNSQQAIDGWLPGQVDKKMLLSTAGPQSEDRLFVLEADWETNTWLFTRKNNSWQEAASLRGAAMLRSDGVALAMDSRSIWSNGRWIPLAQLVPHAPLPPGQTYRARGFPEGGMILVTRENVNAPEEGGPASLFLPVELLTRDRFLAGSVRIPEGWDDLELSFHNTTTGEDYGKWGDLISGGGSTYIHENLSDILGEYGTIQDEAQKIWFVRDPHDHRKLDFYTCFEAHGMAEVRLHRGGMMLGKASRELVFEPIMDRWIRGMDAWADGRAFGLSQSTPGGGFFVSTGNEQPSGLPASGASIFDLPPDGKLDHLARALLVPVFNAVTAARGYEAYQRGLIDGICSGANDDWEFILAIKSGLVLAKDFAWMAAELEIQRWRDDPTTRARELMALMLQGIQDHIVQPVAQHLPDLRITSYQDLKDRVWNHLSRKARQSIANANTAIGWTIDAGEKIAGSIKSWVNDLAGRMGEEAEKFIWTNSPWNTSPLLAGAEAGIVTAWYSLGYCSGYITEQIALGVLTGGVGKLVHVAAKAGGQAALQLAKRAVSAVWFRLHLLKKTLAENVISAEFRLAIERGLVKAAKEPLSATIRDCPAEIIEAALVREGFDRATFSTKLLIDEIGEAIYIKKLCQTTGREAQFWHRLALYFQIMGDNATANASKGLVRSYNRLLKFEGDELIEDRLGDLFTALRCESLAEGRQLARESMEEFATRAAPTRGNEAFKLSAKVAEVYPELYHYKAAKDFLYTRFENGAFKMDARDQGKHYLTPSANATPGSLQLSQIPGVSVAERARYRLKFRVEQIKEKLEIPYSNDLHNGGVTDRLEPITRDNPHLGPGGCVQFTTDSEIVIDEVFDTVLQRNLTTAEVQQLINSATSL